MERVGRIKRTIREEGHIEPESIVVIQEGGRNEPEPIVQNDVVKKQIVKTLQDAPQAICGALIRRTAMFIGIVVAVVGWYIGVGIGLSR